MIQPLYASQKIDSQNRITFCVQAPDAKSVKIEFGKPEGPECGERVYELAKNEKGDWVVTTEPARPGFHYYQMLVDGLKCSDPFAPCYFGWGCWCSGIEVPEAGPAFHDPADVPHGDTRMHWYHSKITGLPRRCLVYTPPGYDTDTQKRYPVFYLQHGSGEGELSWTAQGRANFIMDNLIAAGLAKPFIVVMDSGYAMPPGASAGEFAKNRFGEVLVSDVVPEIDSKFRTIADRKSRAIAGLSMGGGQALAIGLSNLNLFGSICAMSGGGRSFDPATSFGGIFADPAKVNKDLDLLWIGCGQQDGGFAGASAMHKQLESLGVRHTWFESYGSHDWGVWRTHLAEVAKLLFRK